MPSFLFCFDLYSIFWTFGLCLVTNQRDEYFSHGWSDEHTSFCCVMIPKKSVKLNGTKSFTPTGGIPTYWNIPDTGFEIVSVSTFRYVVCSCILSENPDF